VTRAQNGGRIVSLTHRPPLPPGMFLVLISVRFSRLQGHSATGRIMPMKISSDTNWIFFFTRLSVYWNV